MAALASGMLSAKEVDPRNEPPRRHTCSDRRIAARVVGRPSAGDPGPGRPRPEGPLRRVGRGWSWIVIQPVVQMAVFAVLRTALGIAEPGGMSLVIFLYSALLPWNFLTSLISNASPSIFGNASLIWNMAVVREVFPLSAVAA